jgi:hypothetical protein
VNVKLPNDSPLSGRVNNGHGVLHIRHVCDLYIDRQRHRLASALSHNIFLIKAGIHHEERTVYLAGGNGSLRWYRVCNSRSTAMSSIKAIASGMHLVF